MRIVCSSALLAVVLLAAGCSDDSGGPDESDCPLPEDCHGDLTGSWQIAFACPLGEVLQSEDCPNWTCTIESVEAEGSFVFDPDGSAAVHWSSTATTRCDIPKACLEGLTCAEAATEYGHFDCTDTGDACDCVQTDDDSQDLDGTWEVGEYSMLSVTGAEDQMWGTTNFCVEHGRLAVNILHNLALEIPAEFTSFSDAQLVSLRM
jgi:hypothetical protein